MNDQSASNLHSSKKSVFVQFFWFFLLSIGLSWVFFLIGRSVDATGTLKLIIDTLVKFGPSIAGLIMVTYHKGTAGLITLLKRFLTFRLKFYWYLFALLPYFLYIITSQLSGEISTPFTLNGETFNLLFLGSETGIIIYFLFRGGMGEELGWRGYALPLLQAKFSSLHASLIIGIFWAFWHYPKFFYAGDSLVSVAIFTIVVVSLSILFTWLFNNTKGSLFFVTLLHASNNASHSFLEALFPELDDADTWKLFYIIAIVALAIILGIRLYRNDSRHKHPSLTSLEESDER